MRRRWLRRAALAIAVSAIVLGAWVVWLEPAGLTTDEVALHLHWPSKPTLRVAILTDLHVGSPFNGVRKIRAVVDRSNDASPEVVFTTVDAAIGRVPADGTPVLLCGCRSSDRRSSHQRLVSERHLPDLGGDVPLPR